MNAETPSASFGRRRYADARSAYVAFRDSERGIELQRFAGFDRPFPPHFHEHYVFGLMRMGKRMLACGEGEHLLQNGDVMVINPLEAHACEDASGTPLVFDGLNVSADAVSRILELPMDTPHFAAPVVRTPQAAALLGAAIEACAQDVSLEERDEALRDVLACLPLVDGARAVDEAPTSDDEKAIEQARAWLRATAFDAASVQSAAARCGMTRWRFIRMFTRKFGITPHRYVQSVRIRQAQLLLSQGEPPAYVATACGFADQSHLNRVFSRILGITPGLYRDAFCTHGARLRCDSRVFSDDVSDFCRMTGRRA